MMLALLLMLAGPAGAECMATMPFIASGEALPPDPRLVFFWPREYHPKQPVVAVKDARGAALPFTMTRLSRSPAYDAFALNVRAAGGTRFTVSSSSSDWRRVEGSFRVEEDWAPGAAPAGGVAVSSSAYAWPCSFERIRTLRFPASAHAYRVEHRPAGGGPARSTVVPAQPGRFHGDKAPLADAWLKLGHLNCAGWNFRWGEEAVLVRAFPLQPDGTEGAPTPELRLEPPPRVGVWYAHDTPEDLSSAWAAWRTLLWALQSGDADAAKRAATLRGWEAILRHAGPDPARLARAGEGWSTALPEFGPEKDGVVAASWGPAIKAHAFRFRRDGKLWKLDGYSPGE